MLRNIWVNPGWNSGVLGDGLTVLRTERARRLVGGGQTVDTLVRAGRD